MRRIELSLSSPVSLLFDQSGCLLLPDSLGETSAQRDPPAPIKLIKLEDIHRFAQNKRVPLWVG